MAITYFLHFLYISKKPIFFKPLWIFKPDKALRTTS